MYWLAWVPITTWIIGAAPPSPLRKRTARRVGRTLDGATKRRATATDGMQAARSKGGEESIVHEWKGTSLRFGCPNTQGVGRSAPKGAGRFDVLAGSPDGSRSARRLHWISSDFRARRVGPLRDNAPSDR
jgi:hypothetical protein